MTQQSSTKSREDMRVGRWLITLIAVVMTALGVLSVATESYYGYTSKYGGIEVFLEGRRAVLMGLLYISLGAMPLAIWFNTGRRAAWWAGGCALVFAGLLLAVAYG